METSVLEFLRNFPAKPFVVQFVTLVTISNGDIPATEGKTFLIPANSEDEARKIALGKIDSLCDAYRNRNGEVVKFTCLGIHSVEELEYVDDDGLVNLGLILFSRETRPEHLLHDEREDLGPID